MTNGLDVVSVDGQTVGDALGALVATHPAVRSRLFDESGALRRFVNVYSGSEDIRHTGGLSTRIADGDEVSIVPAIAGG